MTQVLPKSTLPPIGDPKCNGKSFQQNPLGQGKKGFLATTPRPQPVLWDKSCGAPLVLRKAGTLQYTHQNHIQPPGSARLWAT